MYAKQDIYAELVEQPLQGTHNASIKKIFTYNQTTGADNFCVTGEEETCVSLRKAPETYPTGTIIKYKVNDTTEKYFHVLADNGDTLTLQQRENTVNQTPWYQDADVTKGPLTILLALENATKGWINVLDQTYALGTTIFKDNSFTGCSSYVSSSCSKNVYTLEERNAKARMITVQETTELGCKNAKFTCPIWMYNYLDGSVGNGGTVNGIDNSYWTSSVNFVYTNYAWNIIYSGGYSYDGRPITRTNSGARAIVMIKK